MKGREMGRRLTRWALACGVGLMGGLAFGCEPSQPGLSPETAQDTARTGCSEEITDEELVKRQGVRYEVNSQTPFTGCTVSYHQNGQREAEINWKNGMPDGLSELYYENGQRDAKINWKDGKRHGLSELYYENGQLEHFNLLKSISCGFEVFPAFVWGVEITDISDGFP